MSIRAIETEYAGHRFRSRLEARYAVFFDAAGIAWQYEVQGFEDTESGFRYLPDFYLPKTNGGVYFEVKGEKPTDEYVINATGVTPRPLVFAVGDVDKCSLWWLDLETPGDMDPHRSVRFNSGTDTMAPYLIDLMGYGRPPAAAIRKAQQARFEHGEKPQTPKAVIAAPTRKPGWPTAATAAPTPNAHPAAAQKIAAEIDRIKFAPHGLGNETIERSCYAIGALVGASWSGLTRERAVDAIRCVLGNWTWHSGEDARHAMSIVDTALDRGAENPAADPALATSPWGK